MRIGGPFTFNPAHAFPVSLGGGQYFYPPPGNWLMTLGAQTCLQWWDPIQYSWRNLAQPNAETFAIQTDGYNWRLINMSGVVAGASITNVGSGGVNGIGPTQTGTVAAFAAPGGNGQTADGYVIIGGSLPALAIANAGSGYVVPPLILIDPPPIGGIQATAVSTITAAGLLATATLVNVGAGYTSLPNVYVVPQFLDYPGVPEEPYTLPATGPIQPNFPPGQFQLMPPQAFMQGLTPAFPITGGALVNFGAGVLGGSGTLTGLVVGNYGSLYATAPAITFAGGTLAGGVAATAIMSLALVSATQTAGAAYVVGNPIEGILGYLTPGTTNFYNNNLLQPRMMRGVVTNANGTFAIEDPGFGMQKPLISANIGVALNSTAAPTTAGVWTIVMGGVTDTSILQGTISE